MQASLSSNLLTYAISTTPNMLTAGVADATITLLATNQSHEAVTIQEIGITIFTGSSDADLTNEPTQVEQTAPTIAWGISKGNEGRGQYKFVFTPPVSPTGFTLQPGSALTFILSNIALNNVPASTTVRVTEGSGSQPYPYQDLTVSIWPNNWGTVNFSASATNLPAGGSDITLKWEGPSGATYQIQYLDHNTQQIVNIPAAGETPLDSNGTYPRTGKNPDPALSVIATTVFTLSVTETINGILYEAQPQQIVTVAEAVPAITSFTGQVAYDGSTPTFNLDWATQNATSVTGSWSTEQLVPNPSTPAIVPLPFTASKYQLTATNAAGQSVQKTIEVGWEVYRDIPVGAGPVAVAVTGNYAFVVNEGSNNVSVISIKDLTVVATIAVGNAPTTIAITPDGNSALVVNYDDDDIVIIDTASLSINQPSIWLGIKNPMNIAISPMGDFAYVISKRNAYSNYILPIAIALSGFTVGTPVDLGAPLGDVAVTNDGAFVLVSMPDNYRMALLNKSDFAVMNSRNDIQSAGNIIVTPNGLTAVVSSAINPSILWEMGTNDLSLSNRLNMEGPVGSLAMAPNGLYAVATGNNIVSIITVKGLGLGQTINLAQGLEPVAAAVTLDSNLVFLSNYANNSVTVLAMQPINDNG